MKRATSALSLALVSLCAAAAPLPATDTAQALAWLSGCWAYEGREDGSGEHWLLPAGGSLLGVARVIKAGHMVEHEFLRISPNAQGKLTYYALPSGQAAAAFVATALSGEAVTFENPAHDFPQRITYRRESDSRLLARIEGPRADGSTRSVDYPMRREPCPAGATRSAP